MSVIGKIIGYATKSLRKAPAANIVSKVETNTAGRILKMQDAKYAFTVGKNYNVVPAKPMQNTSGWNLVTKDNFAEKIAKMYPEGKSGALKFEDLSRSEKIDILRKRSDVRFAAEKYDTPMKRFTRVKDFEKLMKHAKTLTPAKPQNIKECEKLVPPKKPEVSLEGFENLFYLKNWKV